MVRLTTVILTFATAVSCHAKLGVSTKSASGETPGEQIGSETVKADGSQENTPTETVPGPAGPNPTNPGPDQDGAGNTVPQFEFHEPMGDDDAVEIGFEFMITFKVQAPEATAVVNLYRHLVGEDGCHGDPAQNGWTSLASGLGADATSFALATTGMTSSIQRICAKVDDGINPPLYVLSHPLSVRNAEPPSVNPSVDPTPFTTQTVWLYWNKAMDETTPEADLEYIVYRSSADNIRTLPDVLANGTKIDDWAPDIDRKLVIGLSAGTSYYFTVLVRDAAGNTAVYTSTQRTTDQFCGGGDGSTPGTAKQICTLENLNSLRDAPSLHYVLMNDIDAGPTESWHRGLGWEPVAHGSIFSGGLNGNDFAIRNLKVARPADNQVGLFAVLNSTATVERMKLVNFQIHGNEEVGTLAGRADDLTIRYVYAQGQVTSAGGLAGGLVGSLQDGTGSITSSITDVVVTSNGPLTGGLVGLAQATIRKSAAKGTVTASGAGEIGGLIGRLSQAALVGHSFAAGDVQGTDYVGGLIGRVSSGDVSYSFATGNVHRSGSNAAGGVGGLIGWLENGLVSYSVAEGHVSAAGAGEKGGLVGIHASGQLIRYSLATGKLVDGGRGLSNGSNADILRSFAHDRGDGLTCAAATDTNCAVVATGTLQPFEFRFAPHLEYVQMKHNQSGVAMRKVGTSDQTSYPLSGTCITPGATINLQATDAVTTINMTTTCALRRWRAVMNLAPLADGAITITGDEAGVGSKTLNLQKETAYCANASRAGTLFANDNEAGIDGLSPANAFSICNATHFDNLRTNGTAGLHYRLMNNIDLRTGFSAPIGNDTAGDCTSRFCGIFDGNGFTARNAVIMRPESSYVGIFGIVDGAATSFARLGVEDVVVMGADNTGGLIGHHAGALILNDSYVTGVVSTTVVGNDRCGGLLGFHENDGVAWNSGLFADTHIISSSGRTGGLLGAYNSANQTKVEKSYARGNVICAGTGIFCGGLAGHAWWLRDNYSSGHVLSAMSETGGHTGRIAGFVEDSYSTGSVLGAPDEVGGFTGRTTSNNFTADRNYASGHVITNTATSKGGFVGNIGGSNTNNDLRYSLFVGRIVDAGDTNLGAFAGRLSTTSGSAVENSHFWDYAGNPASCIGFDSDPGTPDTCNASAVDYTLLSVFFDQTPSDVYTTWDFINRWKWPGAGQMPVLKWEY